MAVARLSRVIESFAVFWTRDFTLAFLGITVPLTTISKLE
jgi:hypothetical protein